MHKVCIPCKEEPTAASRRLRPAIQWYGWDSRTETWHGPDKLSFSVRPARRLLDSLRATPGKSWYGPVHCCPSEEPEARFFAMVHDLADCAIAMIYCDDSKTGPIEVVAVLPPERRRQLRVDFAFEFLAFTRFLGSVSAGAELQVHDAIAEAVAGAGDSETLIFSINSGMWPSDRELVLSRCVEKIAIALCHWVDE